MNLYVPKETFPGESRIPLVPETVARLVKRGALLHVEPSLGVACGYSDEEYSKAGAVIAEDPTKALAEADIILRLRKPSPAMVEKMKPGALVIGYLEPFTDSALVDMFIDRKIDAVSMEMIPRTTLAQKMDALSSQANLAGYVAVITAADRLNQVLPMMMTPAGTLKPARVFIIGVGVAGLQAIATAKRLGARVEAFDTRPVVEEQVQSLGAKFVKIDLGETGQTKDGYAVELTEAQKELQKQAMAKVISQSDMVITTAQVFGKKAPVIVTRAMVESMRPGSVVVDLAAESGGNVEGARAGEEIDINGVTLIGAENYPGRVPVHASQMYSANIDNLIEHFWDNESKQMRINLDDEIMKGCLIVYKGELHSELLKKARESR